jgi:aspartate racemase
MPSYVAHLRRLVVESVPRLLALPDAATAERPAPHKWSSREILGHLIDSAANNHQRFVRVRFQDSLVFPGYEQDAWVAAQDYEGAPWPELVALWRGYNLHLARIMDGVPTAIRTRSTSDHNLDDIAWKTIPRGEPTTLDYLMEDYVDHLEHHLRQILGDAVRQESRRVHSVGLVGGLGPESTIDYYRRIQEAWRRGDPSSAPALVIDSVDYHVGLRLVANDLPALAEYLLESLRRLAAAGVEFAAITANTPHIVFDDLAARSPVPLLSIVDVCAREAQRRGLRRLGLLGTRFTMEAPFYPDVCARYGIVVVPPTADERTWIHDRYVGQLMVGDFRDDTRREFELLVGRMRDEEGIDGIILGGTELPLLLPTPAIAGLPALDTTALHVAAIVERLRGGG